MKDIKDSEAGKCLYCLAHIEKRRGRWRGHVIPKRLGGSLDFVVPVCNQCNSKIGGEIEKKAVDHELFYLHRLLLGINANSGKPPQGHRVRGRVPEASEMKRPPQKPHDDLAAQPQYEIEGRMSPSLGKSMTYKATKPLGEFDEDGNLTAIAGGDWDQIAPYVAGIQATNKRPTLASSYSFLMLRSFSISAFMAPLEVLGAKIALESLAFLGHATEPLLSRFQLLLNGALPLEVLASRGGHRRLDEPEPYGLVSHVIRFLDVRGQFVCRVEFFGMYYVDFKISDVVDSASAIRLRGVILICDPSPRTTNASFVRIPLGMSEPIPIGFGQHSPRMLTEAESAAFGGIKGEQSIDRLLTIHAMSWAGKLREIVSNNSPPFEVFQVEYPWRYVKPGVKSGTVKP